MYKIKVIEYQFYAWFYILYYVLINQWNILKENYLLKVYVVINKIGWLTNNLKVDNFVMIMIHYYLLFK